LLAHHTVELGLHEAFALVVIGLPLRILGVLLLEPRPSASSGEGASPRSERHHLGGPREEAALPSRVHIGLRFTLENLESADRLRSVLGGDIGVVGELSRLLGVESLLRFLLQA